MQDEYPTELYTSNRALPTFAAALQVAVNAPKPGSISYKRMVCADDGSFFLNVGHLAIDRSIAEFLEQLELIGRKDEEVKKIECIWGITSKARQQSTIEASEEEDIEFSCESTLLKHFGNSFESEVCNLRGSHRAEPRDLVSEVQDHLLVLCKVIYLCFLKYLYS